MKMQRLLHAALLATVLVTVAACGDSKPPDDDTPLPTDPNDPNNATKDTDCDGLSDKVEFETDRNGKKTEPGRADTDKDGLQDGLEIGVDTPVAGTNCTLPKDESVLLKTDPTNPDTDGDGLLDGVEDANKNGKVDSTETSPVAIDTDCDGLIDGPSTGAFKGEDQNANGTKDSGETDPRQVDTDGDGIVDGIELGVTTNPDSKSCTNFTPDANPGTTTDATNPDSDGDGVSDGAEDTNQNGSVDNGELDPKAGDATGPVGQVCTEANLRAVSFKSESGADIKLALPPSFLDADVVQIMKDGAVKGLMGYDSLNKVAFLAFRQPAPANASDALGDEEQLRPAINGTGTLSNRTAQRFRTWDDNDAVQAFYDQANTSTDLKARANQLMDALMQGSTGRLSSTPAGVSGNLRLQTLFVHRSAQSVVVLIALTQLTSPNPVAVFNAKDLSDGSALAQFGEPTAVQCERFQLTTSKVDFLFVVDDSGSMASSQTALGVAAQAAVDALNNTSLDWRMAMVSSNYHFGNDANSGKLRKFTRNVNNVRAWLTQGSTCQSGVCSGVPTAPQPAACSTSDTTQGANNGCWVSTSGNGYEGVLGAARKAIDDITPGTDATQPESSTQARKDASLVVVILGDADDQTRSYTSSDDSAASQNCGGTADAAGSSCENVQNFVNFFGSVSSTTAPTNKTGKLIPVHGIVCPPGTRCACGTNGCEFNPQPPQVQRHVAVVNASGGVLGSITDQSSISASVSAIIANAIGNAGYKTIKPPIGASIKVAVDSVSNEASCNKNDIPRSTVNGFDFDGRARTISLFGACRPATENSQAAVSYRYWINSVTDPNGGVPCENDPNYSPTEPDHCVGATLGCDATNHCSCKPNCGDSCAAGLQCDKDSCSCVVIIG